MRPTHRLSTGQSCSSWLRTEASNAGSIQGSRNGSSRTASTSGVSFRSSQRWPAADWLTTRSLTASATMRLLSSRSAIEPASSPAIRSTRLQTPWIVEMVAVSNSTNARSSRRIRAAISAAVPLSSRAATGSSGSLSSPRSVCSVSSNRRRTRSRSSAAAFRVKVVIRICPSRRSSLRASSSVTMAATV